jgi:hypothetical protein
MTLLQHIKNINAKSQKWMDENPGSWAGMVTEDIKYWNDQGIFTVEDYERDSLITSVYEMHKDAYGVKGRHYNFDKMSNKELEEELERLCKVAQAEREAEEKFEEAAYQTFKNNCRKYKLGASDKETAIKWILEAEGLDNEKDSSYICYSLGLSYDKEYLFEIKH